MFWWGYLHSNGSIQTKRFINNLPNAMASLDDARESPFVVQMYGPFEAEDRKAAFKILKEKLTIKERRSI